MKNTYLKKAWVIGIILLFIGGCVVSAFNGVSFRPSEPLHRGWLYVGGSGPVNYTTIQSAIDNANPGDTVFVYNGIYQEQVNVTKSVILKGQNNISTIVVGGFNVSENYTTIQSFNITGGYEWDPDGVGFNGTFKAGIYTSSSNNFFHNNNICYIFGGSGQETGIIDGARGGIGAGIYLEYCSSNNISLNTLFNITGGSGGPGLESAGGDEAGRGGNGGIGVGIYLQTSNNK